MREAMTAAKDLASFDRPSDRKELNTYLDRYRSVYRAMRSKVDADTQTDGDLVLGRSDTIAGQHLTARLQEQIVEVIHRIRLLENQLRDLVPPRSLVLRIILCFFVTAGVCVFEGIVSQQAFQAWGLTRGSARAASVLFATGMSFIPHAVVLLLQRAQRSKGSIALAIILSGLAVGTYLVLGSNRGAFIRATTENSHMLFLSPIAFAVVALGLMLGLAILSYHVLPRAHQWEAAVKYRGLVRRLRKARTERRQLEEERDAIPEVVRRRLEKRVQQAAFAKGLKERIGHQEEETVSVFIETNARWRKEPMSHGWQAPFRTPSIGIMLALSVGFAASLLITGCGRGKQRATSRSVTVVIDQTNPQHREKLAHDIDRIIEIMGQRSDPVDGRRLRIAHIGSTLFEPTEEYFLPVMDPEIENDMERASIVRDFERTCSDKLEAYSRGVGELDHSIIFPVVVRELVNLQEDSLANERTLIVLSDLVENAPTGWDLYDQSRLDSLQRFPELLEERYGSVTDLGNLRGIRILLVVTPVNYQNSVRIATIAHAYERLLSKHGASVIVTPNLPGSSNPATLGR